MAISRAELGPRGEIPWVWMRAPKADSLLFEYSRRASRKRGERPPERRQEGGRTRRPGGRPGLAAPEEPAVARAEGPARLFFGRAIPGALT